MLALSRKPSESIVIDGNIRITIVSIRANQVRLGIEAPGHVRILREELCLQQLMSDDLPELMDDLTTKASRAPLARRNRPGLARKASPSLAGKN